MIDCPFCLDNNLLEVEVVLESDSVCFVDMYAKEGANAGLLITKRHVESAFDINQSEWQAIHQLLPDCKRYLDKREVPQGYNLGWNIHTVGGQTVNHAHLHIAARFDDEQQAGRGIRYHLKPVRNKRKSSQ